MLNFKVGDASVHFASRWHLLHKQRRDDENRDEMNIGAMSTVDRLAEVLRRSKKNFGPNIGNAIDSLLSPTNLAIMAGVLVVWAGSHFFGVGEIVDVLLLVVGAFTIGWSITDVAGDLYDFANLTMNATCEADLERAAQAFSHAVVLAGITVIMRPGIQSDPSLPAGEGSTSPFGEVRLSPAGSATEQALVRAHELVHRFLTPRFGVLRTFRVQLGMSAYLRSALLQYLEEAIAETVAQLRVNGFSGLLEGIKFPVANGYVSINNLMSEGAAIGTIAAGTQFFSVQFIPTAHDPDVTNVCQ